MNDKITKTREVFQTKKFGLAARIEVAKEAQPTDISEFPNRIGMVFDDSGSMIGNPIELAHQAVETFIKNCNSKDTALAIYPLNAKEEKLSNDYAQLGMYAINIPATGGTPLYETLTRLLDTEKITRAIAFSDGEPNAVRNYFIDSPVASKFSASHENVIIKYTTHEPKVPIDTVFIGNDSRAEELMRDLAEKTGGTYLHFTKPEDMAKNLKYLAPRYRALLANAELKAKVERGEQI